MASLPGRRTCFDVLFLGDDWPGKITCRRWQWGDAHLQQKLMFRARLARCGGYTVRAAPLSAKARQELDLSFLQALTEVGLASDGRRELFPRSLPSSLVNLVFRQGCRGSTFFRRQWMTAQEVSLTSATSQGTLL